MQLVTGKGPTLLAMCQLQGCIQARVGGPLHRHMNSAIFNSIGELQHLMRQLLDPLGCTDLHAAWSSVSAAYVRCAGPHARAANC